MSFMQTWEGPLMSMAQEADISHSPFPAIQYEERHLQDAYAHCEEITAVHSRSFYMASALLPADKRRAVRALYAFCRVTDDTVDCPPLRHGRRPSDREIEAQLQAWRQRIFSPEPRPEDLVAVAWADARARYQVPNRYGEQLIDGVLCDLNKKRYETFDELAEYSYGVASTVGLMSMHIIGFSGPEAVRYAIKLGVALQMTNILRDVGEDWRNGRLYLPARELEAFGLNEADIDRGMVDNRWRAFMRFQIERNRRLYAEAWPGIGMLDKDGRFAIAAAAELYQAILTDIEKHDYDVFNRRSYVGKWGKLSRLPLIWWRSRDFYLRRFS